MLAISDAVSILNAVKTLTQGKPYDLKEECICATLPIVESAAGKFTKIASNMKVNRTDIDLPELFADISHLTWAAVVLKNCAHTKPISDRVGAMLDKIAAMFTLAHKSTRTKFEDDVPARKQLISDMELLAVDLAQFCEVTRLLCPGDSSSNSDVRKSGPSFKL